jgi:hypothetical protein
MYLQTEISKKTKKKNTTFLHLEDHWRKGHVPDSQAS